MRPYQRTRKVVFIGLIGLFLLLGLNQTESSAPRHPLIISEFMAANSGGLLDEDGDSPDWIELHNRGRAPLDLSEFALTDDSKEPAKWPLPARTLNGGERLIIFASGKHRTETELHTNFKLRQKGEFLGLYDLFYDRWADRVSPAYPPQRRDIAYGYLNHTSQTRRYLSATPYQSNEQASNWPGIVSEVMFSQPRGLHREPFTLTLTTATPNATIIYTTDGSPPSETNGTAYTAPLFINSTTLVRARAFVEGWLPRPSTTASYIFVDDVLHQPRIPPGFPKTWGVHPIAIIVHQPGDLVVADYEMDPEIVQHPEYGAKLADALYALPMLSLVTGMENMHIYANPRAEGRQWERPVSMEFIDPTRGESFQLNAGVRIQGGAGRWEFMPKHSFKLFFRGSYGYPKLPYPIFPSSLQRNFDTLILRAGTDRSFAGHPDTQDHRLTTYARDLWLSQSQIDMSGFGPHGQFVHVYLNGLYWGIYNMVERPDEAFTATHFGGQPKEWLVANQSGLVSGLIDRLTMFNQMLGQGDFTNPDHYKIMTTFIDVEQFSDYIIMNWYAGNRDWPHNNWYLNLRNPDGKIRFVSWDGESTWDEGARLRLGSSVETFGLINQVRPIFEAFTRSPEFKLTFADRAYAALFHDGPLSDEQSKARFLRVSQPLETAIVAESARWGDVRYKSPITPDDWQHARQQLLSQMDGNGDKLIALLREADYYPPFDPPQVEQRSDNTLSLSAAGPIYYTTDGRDPRTPLSGAISPTAQRYTAPLNLAETVHLKARTLIDGQWSALHEQFFTLSALPNRLQISEIMYNPIGGSSYEFIELHNNGDSPLNLAGYRFEGIRYTFPAHTPPLPPQSYIVLVRNAAHFAQRYPNIPFEGVYQGKLANQGETLIIRDRLGQIVVRVDYRDSGGWPLTADGRGDSLVFINPQGEPNAPQNWQASRHTHGSPGRADGESVRP